MRRLVCLFADRRRRSYGRTPLTRSDDISLDDADWWPEHARQIAMKLNAMHADLRAFRRAEEYRDRGEYLMARDLIEEVRQSKTVQDGLIKYINIQRAAMDAVRAELVAAKAETAKIDEAIAILDTMEKEGGDALVEGTTPSTF